MGCKIKVSKDTYEYPACGYRWTDKYGIADLSYNEEECCPCCPDCGELIEDGGDY